MSAWAGILCGAHPGQVFTGASPASVAARIGRGAMVYLATPYSKEVVGEDGGWSYELSLLRQAEASYEARRLGEAGITAISPIAQSAAMCHLTARGPRWGLGPLDPLDAGWWTEWCRPLLRLAPAVVVPDLPGWWRSAGILEEAEAKIAQGGLVFLYAEGSPE